MYFFRREKIQCRYQFSLRDAVDITLLQRALTAALASAPYYTQRLVQEKREMWLEPNTEPCLVYPGSTMRNIPEQTNGYLFCVSCEGDTVYFDWHHFLLDGHGVSPLLTSILEQYCNLRYGTAFAVPQIVCDPPYDMEAMLAEYPPVEYGSDVIQRDVVQTYEGALRRTRVCLSKQSLVEKALANNAKPVSALMGLLCMAMREYLGKEKIQYSYSSDTRDVAGVPNALYNCVCSFGHTVQLQAQTRLADFVADVDADIRRDLQPESKRHRMADQMGWVYKVDQQKRPAHQAAGVPDGRVHRRHDFGFLAQLSGQSAHACHPGAGTVHHGFWRLGTAGRCIRGCGGCQPERKDHSVHPQQGTQPGSG